MTIISERLKYLRTSKGLTQENLAKKLNTTNSSISDWECGRSSPSAEMIKEIALFFDVRTDYLLGLEDE